MESDALIQARIEAVLSKLNERQKRIYLWAEASSLGWGGISKISRLSGASRLTIAKGKADSQSVDFSSFIREKGGGRKKISETYP